MKYTSIADLADTIRKNAWKVPADIELIVGVPRSGLMAALILGEILNKPVIDLDGFTQGRQPKAGAREHLINRQTGRVLVLDDTVYSGGSMVRVKAQVQSAPIDKEVLFGCVYAEGKNAKEMVDIFLEDNYSANDLPWHLYEWNILHHGIKLSAACMYDLDGVLCKEPPDERQTELYENYIANARQMVIPTTQIGAIVTYRLEKYRALTESWLKKAGVQYERLIMYPAPEHICRTPEAAATYKANEYRKAYWAKLFVESDPKQAELIARKTDKRVFCYENGKMYE